MDSQPSFWSAGDGAFASGAYSRITLDGQAGAGVEVRVSVPITDVQWQILNIGLAGLDLPRWRRWDHFTGAEPATPDQLYATCAFVIPNGEGARSLGAGTFSSGRESRRVALPWRSADAAWHRVRLQTFPDGRCGLALDGRPVAMLDGPMSLDRPLHVVLSGKSVGTTLLVGPLRAWEGVEPGIEWFAGNWEGRGSSAR
jgi:hypothetical protein